MRVLWNDEQVILGAIARGASIPTIALVLGYSVMTVRRRLDVLRAQELVFSDGTGYRLTDLGREVVSERAPA